MVVLVVNTAIALNVTGCAATDSILTSMLYVFYGHFKKIFLKEEDHVWVTFRMFILSLI